MQPSFYHKFSTLILRKIDSFYLFVDTVKTASYTAFRGYQKGDISWIPPFEKVFRYIVV